MKNAIIKRIKKIKKVIGNDTVERTRTGTKVFWLQNKTARNVQFLSIMWRTKRLTIKTKRKTRIKWKFIKKMKMGLNINENLLFFSWVFDMKKEMKDEDNIEYYSKFITKRHDWIFDIFYFVETYM